MGSVLEHIDDGLAEWIEGQPLFFVGTAPRADDGHVNISPKGTRGSFRVLGPHRFGYVDLFGSGIETVAHLNENGRIVVMFCAFEGPPRIVRLHGRGTVLEPASAAFPGELSAFDLPAAALTSVRSIVTVDVTRIADSCGFVVPEMTVTRERDTLFRTADTWIRRHGPDAITRYCAANNAHSIDGLDGLTSLDVAPADLDGASVPRSKRL